MIYPEREMTPRSDHHGLRRPGRTNGILCRGRLVGLESRDIHEESDIQANHHHNRTSVPRMTLAWHYLDHTLGSSQKRGLSATSTLGS